MQVAKSLCHFILIIFFFAAFRRGPLFLMETHPAFLQPGLDLLETNFSLQDFGFGFGSLTLHSVILRFFFFIS